MKNTTNTSVAGEPTPTTFNGTDMNHWSWQGKMTPKVIYNYLQYLCRIMTWLSTTGKSLLEKVEPLTFSEYQELLEYSFNLWYQMGTDRPVCLNFTAVVRKGIWSLMERLRADIKANDGKWDDKLWQKYSDWQQSLMYQLQAGTRCGMGSRSCRDEESIELIESTVPIAQMFCNVHLLRSIAENRYPHQPEVQEWFVEKNKNW